MSERSKGIDTSSTPSTTTIQTSGTSRIVKNSLFSASVTGLTFDDFSNKPLLLPAAPPIDVAQIKKEISPTVTVGKTPDIDIDTLSEINLNSSPEEDSNANFLAQELRRTDGSILSQAASSFSQLPSVASTVFSSFSKRIKDYSPVPGFRDDISEKEYNPNINLTTEKLADQLLPSTSFEKSNLPGTLSNTYSNQINNNTIQNLPVHELPVELPKLYTAEEIPILSKNGENLLAQNPPVGGSNNYRLTAKKKIYAPIPNFTAHVENTQTNISKISTQQIIGQTLPPISQSQQVQSSDLQQEICLPLINLEKQEERKGLFSLSNFAPTNVFQNLSGFVQSATGSITGKVQISAENLGDTYQLQPSITGTVPTSTSPQSIQQNPTKVSSTAQSQLPIESYQQTSTTAEPLTTNRFVRSDFTENSQSIGKVNEQQLIKPPTAILPPSGPGLVSPFRLQKGTKLYKSPFSQLSNPTTTVANQDKNTFSVFNSSNQDLPILNPLDQQQPINLIQKNEENQLTILEEPQFEAQLIPEKNLTSSTLISFGRRSPQSTEVQFDLSPIPGNFLKDQSTHNKIFENRSTLLTNQTEVINKQSTEDEVFGQPPKTVGPPSIINYFNNPLPTEQINKPSNTAPANSFNALRNPSSQIKTSDNLLTTTLSTLNYSGVQSELKASVVDNNIQKETLTPNLNKFEEKSTVNNLNSVNPFSATHFFTPSKSEESTVQSQQKFFTPTSQSNFHWFTPFGPTDSKKISSEKNSNSINLTTNNQEEKTNISDITLPPPPVSEVLPPQPNTKDLANFLPPPPQTTAELNIKPKSVSNPYRRGSQTLHTILPTPTLSSIFTPSLQDSSSAFDFFETISAQTSISDSNDSSSEKSIKNSLTTADLIEANIAAKNNQNVEGSIPPPLLESTLLPSEHFKPPADDSIDPFNPFTINNPPLVGEAQIDDQLTTIHTVSKTNVDSIIVKQTQNESSNIVESLKQIASTSDNIQQKNNLAFFDKSETAGEPENQNKPLDPLLFFDSFAVTVSPSTIISSEPTITKTSPIAEFSEDPNSQRIQNFFNNPPPQDVPDLTSDLNYNLVGSGLSIKNLQIRSLTPASNLVEPPSSSCSDFSELNTSTASALIAETTSKKTSPNEDLIPEEFVNELKMSNQLSSDTNMGHSNFVYQPAAKHWFYKRNLGDSKFVWIPFSHYDSEKLEESFLNENSSKIVPVEGGRHDVDVVNRTKAPVYWTAESLEVRRCSWFFKAADSKFIPYDEGTADHLEEEYRQAATSGEWHKKILISTGETVVFHGPIVIVHFLQPQSTDSWGGASPPTSRPRVVKRDLADFTIEQGEHQHVDHLLFMVHGIGSACDLKMRSVEEVVDEFRSIAFQLIQSHYKNSCDSGVVGRIEVLPVSWHEHLHSEELGIDEKLKAITLESIPKLRSFTNDTLLDILFYTSPVFCQKIMTRVSASMNSIYAKYRTRHPEFKGGVSVAGHSLGSLILFDLLCHQKPIDEDGDEQNKENPDQLLSPVKADAKKREHGAIAKQVSYTMGPAGTGQPFINYPQLSFQPHKFFALGSPIGMFVTIRGIDKLGLEFKLPTCSGFYNIFHPYDPVAYRIEALVNPDMNGIRPVLIPHHKGRKRMHLELKETMIRVGADIKQRVVDTFRNTIDSVNFLSNKKSIDQQKEIEKQVDKVLENQNDFETQNPQPTASTSSYRSRADSTSTQSDNEMIEIDFPLGKLNDSKRIDFVLQEAPLEFFNEYLFALSSHVCYWDSSDTILFVTKEIYTSLYISPDSQVPQQSMTIERPDTDSTVSS